MIRTVAMMMMAMPARAYVMMASSSRVVDARKRIDLAEMDLALDIGCGYGISTLELKEMTPRASVIGIDYDKSKIMTARRIVGDHHDDLCFEHKNAINTGLRSNMFDLVQFKHVLCQASYPEDMIGEARRLLRPGGLVIVYEKLTNRELEGLTSDQLERYYPEYITRRPIDHLLKYFSGFDPCLHSVERDMLGLVLCKI